MKKMNEQLEELLELKRLSASAEAVPDAGDVAAAFLVRIRRRRRRLGWSLALAASLLLALAGVLFLPGAKETAIAPRIALNGMELLEAQRLFGDEVAVAFLNGELITGERLSPEKPNLRLSLELVDPATGKSSRLIFAGSDNDTIVLDSPLLAGEIILSRSDCETTVVEYLLRTRKNLEIRNIALVHHG